MASDQQFSLRWNNYQTHIVSAFESLRDEEDFVDVTLGCEGRKIRAHKMLLSACSPYFRELLKDNPCQHPIVILRDVHYNDLQALVEFMYNGQVNVSQDQLSSFLQTAEVLKIRGLAEGEDKKLTDKEPDEEINETDTAERPLLSSDTEALNRGSESHSKGTEISSRGIESYGRGAESRGRESPPPKRKKQQQFSADRHTFATSSQSANVEEMTMVPEPEVLAVEVKAEVPDYEAQDTSQDTGYDGCGENMGDGVQEGLDSQSQPERGLYGSGLLQSDTRGAGFGLGLQVSQQQSVDGTSDQSVSVVSKPGPSTVPDTCPDTSQGVWSFGWPPGGEADGSSLMFSSNKDVMMAVDQEMEETVSSKGRHCCNICGKVFRHTSSLYQHKKTHSGGTTCPVCSRVLSRQRYLMMHLRSVHGVIGSALTSDTKTTGSKGAVQDLRAVPEAHMMKIHQDQGVTQSVIPATSESTQSAEDAGSSEDLAVHSMTEVTVLHDRESEDDFE